MVTPQWIIGYVRLSCPAPGTELGEMNAWRVWHDPFNARGFHTITNIWG